METSIEVGRHTEPQSRSHREPGDSAWSKQVVESSGTEADVRPDGGRVSVDPMRTTDRYRLVLPCDLKL